MAASMFDDALAPRRLPRPSYCGAAAAVTFCVASLAGAVVAGFAVTSYLIDHLTRRHRP